MEELRGGGGHRVGAVLTAPIGAQHEWGQQARRQIQPHGVRREPQERVVEQFDVGVEQRAHRLRHPRDTAVAGRPEADVLLERQ